MARDNEALQGHTDLVESVILENDTKDIQYRFTISEFRGVHYISIREWYLDFEGEYSPSKNGVTLPYSLHTTTRLYKALTGILSDAEVLDEVILKASE
jgi:hypothetical protein